MKLTTYNGETNQTIESELEGDALKAMESDIAKLAAERKARIDLKKENELAKSALLERLGITADEAALLLG